MTAFVAVQLDDTGPGLLVGVPLSRGRTVRATSDNVADLPADIVGVRALAVVGVTPPATPSPKLAALIRRCHRTSVPVLGVGTGGAVVSAALAGAAAAPGDEPVRLLVAHRTREAASDSIGEGLPEGHRWLAAGTVTESPGAVVVARAADGEPLIVRFGMASYATCLLPQLDGTSISIHLDGLLDATPRVAVQLSRFMTAHHAAFSARWVDAVVGRTEDERPWGRRGPDPKPHPDAYLNPA